MVLNTIKVKKIETMGTEGENSFSCDICQKTFNNVISLNRHKPMHVSPDEMTFKCNICDRKLMTAKGLKNHKKRHTQKREKRCKCELCGDMFDFPSRLQRHMLVHTGEQPYSCHVCGRSFNSATSRNNHCLIHTGVKRFHCDVCDKAFRLKGDCVIHRRIHTGEAPYKCKICQHTFKSSSSLSCHAKIHMENRPYYQCDVCEAKLTTKHGLKSHMTIHTNKKNEICHLCGKEFSQKSTLKKHIECTHSRIKRFGCEICEKRFPDKGNLERHIRTHIGEKPYTCDKCDKSFGDKSMLNQHSSTVHSEQRPYKCQSCGKSFKRPSELKRHQMIHTNVKLHKYSCSVCGKTLSSPSNLRLHMMRHRNEKPFKCESCGKGFVSKSVLELHERIHAEQKPYTCDVCQKGFHQFIHLEAHLTYHSGYKAYCCPSCPKQYRSYSGLQCHLKKHDDLTEKPRKKTNVKPKDRKMIIALNASVDSLSQSKGYEQVSDEKNSDLDRDSCINKYDDDNILLKFECDVCKTKYDDCRTLRQHLLFHIQDEMDQYDKFEKAFCQLSCLRQEDEKEILRCNICEKAFGSINNLREHMTTHDNLQNSQTEKNLQRSFKNVKEKASICGRKDNRQVKCLTNPHKNSKHFLNENGKTNAENDQIFNDSQRPKKHKQIHKSRNRYIYKCDICKKTFSETSVYQNHLTLHVTKKPYVLLYDVLKMNTVNQENVLGKIKNDLKTFCKQEKVIQCLRCFVCEKVFAESRTLQRHLQFHTESDSCEVFEKAFNQLATIYIGQNHQ